MAIRIKVSELLGKKKMSMKGLSDLTGITPSAVSLLYYEETKRIEIAQIDALCKAFQCNVGDIFEYIED